MTDSRVSPSPPSHFVTRRLTTDPRLPFYIGGGGAVVVMDVTRTLKNREPVVASHRVTTDPDIYECNSLALAGGDGGVSTGPVGSRLLAGTNKQEIVELQVCDLYWFLTFKSKMRPSLLLSSLPRARALIPLFLSRIPGGSELTAQ